MGQYHIGIDFGTSQTKICSTNMSDNPLEKGFIFHKFSSNNEYLLPSTIKVNINGSCSYGNQEPNLIRYFKMKSLFDDHPNYQVDNLVNSGDILNQETLSNYPEICSILYIAYCILDVKASLFSDKAFSSVVSQNQTEKSKSSNPLFRFFKKKSEKIVMQSEHMDPKDNNSYFFTIGIPTEFDRTEDNYWRRCKQYEILYLALSLADYFGNLRIYLEARLPDLLRVIKVHYREIQPSSNESRLPQEFYEDKGLFVIAETTAGIVPFRDELQRFLDSLENTDGAHNRFKTIYMGNYLTMDVGAGTTDISFFKLYRASGMVRMKYFASKSIPIASNSLILKYFNSNNLDDIIGFDIDKKDEKVWNKAQKDIRSELFEYIRSKESNLYFKIVGLFPTSHRENWHFEFNISKGCKVYGGGSRFNEFSKGEMMLHNGGVNISSYRLQTYTKLEKFIHSKEFKYNIRLLSATGAELSSSEQDQILSLIDILNTSLGLAIVDFKNRPDGENGWIDMPFNPRKDGSGDDGMAMYDIFNRDWI